MARWAIFDVNGTLTDPAAITSPWERPDLGEAVLALAVHTAMVETLTASETAHPFSAHLRSAIEATVAEHSLSPDRVEDAVAAAAALPARPEAREALALLTGAGMQLAALTNSGASDGQATLDACGLSGSFQRILGVDAVSRFKPDPSVYAYALRELGANPDDVTFVAAHPWDLAGARTADVRTAWVRHGARAWPAAFVAPDVQADGLLELARAIV